jgi:hypothetical protein
MASSSSVISSKEPVTFAPSHPTSTTTSSTQDSKQHEQDSLKPPKDRASLLKFAKARARKYLKQHEHRDAVMSLAYDMQKWELYPDDPYAQILLLEALMNQSPVDEKFIDSFNLAEKQQVYSKTNSTSATTDSKSKERARLLKLAKTRALEYLERHEPQNAITSLMSDFQKWDLYSSDSCANMLLMEALTNPFIVDAKFINDFN